MAEFLYDFDWDPAKAKANLNKHGIDFERAGQVFRDPLAVTIPDDEHSETEARWITLGADGQGQLLVVIHTFEQLTNDVVRVRLISARRPSRSEVKNYQEQR